MNDILFSNIPNLLSLSRLPLGVALFACIAHGAWLAGLIIFGVAAFTDWLDGWWARRFQCGTAIGRNLDPLTDKVLIGGAFIFLIPVPGLGIEPWIVTVIIGRELLITGLRGIVEATGKTFGADWFGKLKTVLQFAVLFAALGFKAIEQAHPDHRDLVSLQSGFEFSLLPMIVATVGSAVQYGVKAVRLLRVQL